MRVKRIFEGYIEKVDLQEFIGLIYGVPFYPTRRGVERRLAGYDGLRIGKIKISVSWEEAKP